MPEHRLPLILALLVAWPASGPAQPLEITGFVDASWVYNTADRNGEFGVDQVELDILHRPSPQTLVRTDLEWLKDGEDHVAQVEQAFMSYTARCGWVFTFGKYNAPFGFEEYDAPDLYQFSSGLVSDHGLPGNLTGFSLGKDLARGLDLLLMGSNGWDRGTETGGTVTWAGRLEYTHGGFVGGLSAISGKEEDEPDEDEGSPAAFTRTVFDVDLSFESDRWVFGAEYNQGRVTHAGGGEQTWSGILLMANRAFGERVGLTVRYDLFDDQDGYAFAAVGGEFQQRQAIAIAPSYSLDEGLDVILEARLDLSDRDAFLDRDGEYTDRSLTIAFEMLYSF
jgi:hypothetical protein